MTVESNPLEVTWGLTLQVWWSFVWRATLWSALFGGVVGLIKGIIIVAAGRPDLGGPAGMLFGTVGYVPESIIAMRAVVRKQFDGFSFAPAPPEARP